MRSRRLSRLVLGVGALACATALVASAAQGDAGRVALNGSKPAWVAATPRTSTVPSTKTVTAKVWLASRDQAGLDALARAVSDPKNAAYRHFLTHAQYTAQYAPTSADVQAVKDWLTSAGLTVTKVGPDNHYLAVSGSADAANSAFGTTLSVYQVKGKAEQAPSSDLSVPGTVAGKVLAVTGLATFGHRLTPNDFGPPPGFVNAQTCGYYFGKLMATSLPQFQGQTLSFSPCGYTPAQLRWTYGEGGTTAATRRQLGVGATVAITDAFDAPTLQKDANQYASNRGEDPFKAGQFQDRSVPEDQTKGGDCGGNGWYAEQALDIEAVHGMAPAANVLYYGGASCYDDDLLAALSSVVSDNNASIVTNSWGEPSLVVIDGQVFSTIDPTLVNAYESVFKQGIVQGQGFYFSSGDNGDEADAYGIAHPDWPTEDPWVTSVGGTSLGIGQNFNRLFETGWGTSRWNLSGNQWVQTVPFLYGSGGGYTDCNDQFCWPEPWYQAGVANSPNGTRSVPDIAMDGDPNTGMLIGMTQAFALPSSQGPQGVHYGEFRIGGTSLSSPLFAGFQAVAEGSKRIGFANPLIYSFANAGVYYDVTPQGPPGEVRADFVNGYNASNGYRYTVRTFDQDSSLTTGPGWDDVTGVGAPTQTYLNLVQSRLNQQ
jgi:subtilase family serine protease